MHKDLAIIEGIKAVGVGKRGSKSLDPDLTRKILNELRTNDIPDVVKGAFFGALCIKGVQEDEKLLEQAFTPGILENPKQLVDVLVHDAPDYVKDICVRFLQHDSLDVDSARRLGEFLFSTEPGDVARGMVASILRVRYETPDEYEGLLHSMEQTIEENFRGSIAVGDPIIQFAEPFDGVDHSNLITPLLAQCVQSLNYRAVSLVGRNSGPKFGNNLLDVAKGLGANFLTGVATFTDEKKDFGWYIHQAELSKAMDRWVDLRQSIVKRPFLATLERFVNPLKADILIASAFHPPYGEKMITICERAGFPGAVIIRNGLEGTMAFPLKRAAKILCTARQKDGSYKRHEFEMHAEKMYAFNPTVEERLTNPSLEKNIELIQTFHEQGETGYELFDMRIKLTCAGLKQAITWIEQNKDGQ